MKTTTWIIIIILVFIIIAVIVGILLYFLYFRGNKNTNRRETTTGGGSSGSGGDNGNGGITTIPLRYGDTIGIFNPSSGYLYLCGGANNRCDSNVAATNNVSKIWRITSSNNILIGTTVKYGESFTLQEITNNSYLGYCGDTNRICGTNVGTKQNADSTTTWTFDKAGTNADVVNKNINLIITNNNDNNRLNICGQNSQCGFEVTNANNTAAPGLTEFSTWQVK